MTHTFQSSFIAVNIAAAFLADPLNRCPQQDEKLLSVQEASQIVGARLLTVTSRLMEWSPGQWILDLTPCQRYWSYQAKRQGLSLEGMVQRQLETILGAEMSAVWTDHPWRSVLLATYMRERGLRGFVMVQGDWNPRSRGAFPLRTMEKLVRDLSWDSWWSSWEILGEHFQSQKKSFRALFRRERLAMQRAVVRLGCKVPGEWASIGASSLGRRFGKMISQVWRWTYQHSGPLLWQNIEFPWQSFYAKDSLRVTRHLEEPLWEWASVEPWLIRDFDRLREHPALRDNEGILRVDWTLLIGDSQEKTVSILFRYPHSLQAEKGHHKTSCLQARYAFEEHIKDESDPLLPPPVISGWRLSVEASLIQAPEQTDIFGERTILSLGDERVLKTRSEDSRPCSELLQLENRLLVPLSSYRPQEDWTPEDSFIEGERPSVDGGEQGNSLQALGKKRPLFIYREPSTYKPSSEDHFSFTERTMVKWWQHQDSFQGAEEKKEGSPADGLRGLYFKDFYLVEEVKSHRYMWVYKDPKTGGWFVQGVYA